VTNRSILSAIVAIFAPFPVIAADVTFSKDVAPILYRRCVSCHHPNDIAPMSFLTYQDVRPWAAAIKEAVLSRKMPPWQADPHIGKWANDPSLTAGEIATLKTWIDGAKLPGNLKDMPAAPVLADGWKGGQPDAVFTIPEQHLEAKGPDEYMSFQVPTHFTEDRWVTSIELQPGNRKVVHHAHVFAVVPVKNAAKAAPNPETEYVRFLRIPDGRSDGHLLVMRPNAPVIDDGCLQDDNGQIMGGKFENEALLGTFLPGREPDVLPTGGARRIPGGAVLRFQIHYSHTTGRPETDATRVGLIFSKTPPKVIVHRLDLANDLFLVPPRDANHPVCECHTWGKDVYITSLTAHMHLRGKSMRFELTYPDGKKKTILNVPNYDFNWQTTYRLASPIFAPKGTRIRIDAVYDNSANNKNNPDPSSTVRWGQASVREMMNGWIEYIDAGGRVELSKMQASK
jgi:hypothetical protein